MPRSPNDIAAELERLAAELRALGRAVPRVWKTPVTCGLCRGSGGVVGFDGRWRQCPACAGMRRTR